MKKLNWKGAVLPLLGLMSLGLGFAGTGDAAPFFPKPAFPVTGGQHPTMGGCRDLQVRVWVDPHSVRQNRDHTYNFVIQGQVKNIGGADYVSRRNQQSLYLHTLGSPRRITEWHFSRMNRGQVMNVHVPVRHATGGEFTPSYELALDFDPDILIDGNPANDDCNIRNNQATLSNTTLNHAFARASGLVRHLPHMYDLGPRLPRGIPRWGLGGRR